MFRLKRIKQVNQKKKRKEKKGARVDKQSADGGQPSYTYYRKDQAYTRQKSDQVVHGKQETKNWQHQGPSQSNQ